MDLSSLGAFNTAVAAMFSRLGVPIKTTVAPMVGLRPAEMPWGACSAAPAAVVSVSCILQTTLALIGQASTDPAGIADSGTSKCKCARHS